jgi:uncharacterized protein (TIGR02172 family)
MALGEFIARGREAEVFAWDDGSQPAKVLKLFFPAWSEQSVRHELNISQAVIDAGVAAPAVFGGVVERDGRFGIVYERVYGVSMIDALASKPWQVRSAARRLADIQAEMHRGTPSGLPRLKDRLARNIGRAKPLSDEQKTRALDLLERLPDGPNLCHGDFHPGNIILKSENGEPTIIDWPNATVGDPAADVARTRLLLTVGWHALPGRKDRFLAQILTSLLARSHTARYCEVTGVKRVDIDRWQTVMAAARLGEEIAPEQKHLLKIVQSGLAQA